MQILNKEMTKKQSRPVKVLQFGEGNFLRAFVDYMLDIANEKGKFDGDIVLVKPIEFGNLDRFKAQDCQYTVSLRGIADGKETVINRIVTSVADAVGAAEDYQKYVEYGLLDTLRFVVSNTTEAGIVYDETDCFELEPPKTYPGKLTKLLYLRYEKYAGALDKGLIILPVELIDDNGIHLKECVLKLAKLWNLGDGFTAWVQEACVFCSTLVDRIVTGYPREEAAEMCRNFGYEDNLIVTAEPFGLWVIESDKEIKNELPLDQAGLPVIYTDNQKPYKHIITLYTYKKHFRTVRERRLRSHQQQRGTRRLVPRQLLRESGVDAAVDPLPQLVLHPARHPGPRESAGEDFAHGEEAVVRGGKCSESVGVPRHGASFVERAGRAARAPVFLWATVCQ